MVVEFESYKFVLDPLIANYCMQGYISLLLGQRELVESEMTILSLTSIWREIACKGMLVIW